MAKITKKKVKKVKSKKSSKTPEVIKKKVTIITNPDVDYDDGEDEVVDENLHGEDEENGSSDDDERKHQKLLDAISSLGGGKKNRKKKTERSEATVQMSEFTVNAEGEGGKINLSDLIGTMEKTPAVSIKTKKQLKHLRFSNGTIDSPLNKQETERIQRDLAFQKAATEVSRWQGVVRQNEKAEQLVFPLNKEHPGPKVMEQVVSGWEAKTPLEQEIFKLLSINKQPVHDPVLTPLEEASLKAMSLEEAKIRRAELQKARALQSYYEAKAKRERKIKSKVYHRVQNKSKRKEHVKQFDEMVKTDPAAALEELKKLELTRMKERMSLKHQNSGKWAKSKAIMAKYDEGARKAMQQQLEVNKELTEKLVSSLNNEEEEDEEGDPEMLPDFVNDQEPVLDSTNPWMRGKLSKEPAEEEEEGDSVEPISMANPAEEEEGNEPEVEETEEEVLLREFDAKRKRRQAEESDTVAVIHEVDDIEENGAESAGVAEENGAESAGVETVSDDEEEELSEFTSLYKGITDSCPEENTIAAESAAEAPTQLEEGLVRVKTLEDVELLAGEESTTNQMLVEDQEVPVTENPQSDPPVASKKRKKNRGLELKEVLTKDAKVIRVPMAPTAIENTEEDKEEDQRDIIRQAFAGDDVISDFLKDKRKQEAAGRPTVVDLTLPGWGEWGGVGIVPSRRKRKRFTTKAAPAAPRKDRNLPSVIISDKRDSTISLYQVSSLPFPFETPAQFESTIRSPVGRTWNTEQTVKKITKPKVVTQMGAIIDPITREDLVKAEKKAVEDKQK